MIGSEEYRVVYMKNRIYKNYLICFLFFIYLLTLPVLKLTEVFMSLNYIDKIKILSLVKDGWKIPEIHTKVYPKEKRQDIEEAVYTAVISISHGDRSKTGRITSTLKKFTPVNKRPLLDDLNSLSAHLYRNLMNLINYYYINDTS